MMEIIKEDMVDLVQKSVQTINAIENADRQLNGLQALTLMKRDFACKRIKQATEEYQEMVSKVAAMALSDVASAVKAREDQLSDQRRNLTDAKNSLLARLQEIKAVVMGRSSSADIATALQLRKELKKLVETDYTPHQWEMFSSLEFVTHTEETRNINLGYLRTSALDPCEMSLSVGKGHSEGIVMVGQQVTLCVNNKDGFRAGWEEHLKMSVTGPSMERVKHTVCEQDSSVVLGFNAEKEGPYVVDVKAYNTRITPCPLTLWAISGLGTSKRCHSNMIDSNPSQSNRKSPLGNSNQDAHEDETESQIASPKSDIAGCASSFHTPRAYGPRAARRMSVDHLPPQTLCNSSPERDDAFEVQSAMRKINLGENEFERAEFATPIIIQPVKMTPMRDSCVDAFNVKEEPEFCITNSVKTSIKNNGSLEIRASPTAISEEGEIPPANNVTTRVNSRQAKTSKHAFYVAGASGKLPARESVETPVTPTKARLFNGARAFPKSTRPHHLPPNEATPKETVWRRNVAMGSIDRVENVQDIPLPIDPWPGATADDMDISISSPSGSHAEKPSFCFLTNLVNLHAGRDIPAKMVLSLGNWGGDNPYGFSFPIGVTTTRPKTDGSPDIITCDTGNNLVKVFTWSGTLKLVLGIEESGISFRRPSSVVTNIFGDIFVKDDRLIQKFSATGQFIMPIGKNILQKPYGLKLINKGKLVTLDHRLRAFVVFDAVNGDKLQIIKFMPLEGRESRFRFIAVHEDKVIAVNLGQHEVIIASLKTGQVLTTLGGMGHGPGQFNEPSGITTDKRGNILIADSRNNRIQVFDKNGNFLSKLALDVKIVRPSDIHLTDDWHLVVDSYLQHSIKVFKLG